jgi:chromosomal replication initiator protein
VGENNQFTYTLAKAVAGNPGGEYNPFFVYGNVGLGKTHLINAIGNEVRSKFPDQRVGYVSASHFARKLAEASEEQALETFRENYAHRDVLILDDIQFLSGRIEAQEEFFHLFNALHQNGRQIVIAADKAPDKLGLLEQRLVSRFSGGIVSGLNPPDMETRMAILRHYATQSEVQAPPEILSFIAMRVPNDVRKMTGALSKVLAFARLTKQPLTYEMAVQGLKHLNTQGQDQD